MGRFAAVGVTGAVAPHTDYFGGRVIVELTDSGEISHAWVYGGVVSR
jgi:hypothetical protein